MAWPRQRLRASDQARGLGALTCTCSGQSGHDRPTGDAAADRRRWQPGVPRARCCAAVSETCRRHGRRTAWSFVQDGDLADHPAARSTCSGSTTTARRTSPPGTATACPPPTHVRRRTPAPVTVPGGDVRRAVVVDPEEVDLAADGREVAVPNERPVADRAVSASTILRIAAGKQRLEEHPVGDPVDLPDRVPVGRSVSEAGRIRCRFSAMDTSVPGRSARMRSAARPWPRLRWCARPGRGRFGTSGACTPDP